MPHRESGHGGGLVRRIGRAAGDADELDQLLRERSADDEEDSLEKSTTNVC